MVGNYRKGIGLILIASTLAVFVIPANAVMVRDRDFRGPGVDVGRPVEPARGRYLYNGRYYPYYINGHYYNYYNNGQYYLYYNNGVYSNDLE